MDTSKLIADASKIIYGPSIVRNLNDEDYHDTKVTDMTIVQTFVPPNPQPSLSYPDKTIHVVDDDDVNSLF